MGWAWAHTYIIFLWYWVLFGENALFCLIIKFNRTAKISVKKTKLHLLISTFGSMSFNVKRNKYFRQTIFFLWFIMQLITYFSARTHIVWHSSSVILLNISTSNGPPSLLFSSFTNTARPSQRLSAAKFDKIFESGKNGQSFQKEWIFSMKWELVNFQSIKDTNFKTWKLSLIIIYQFIF